MELEIPIEAHPRYNILSRRQKFIARICARVEKEVGVIFMAQNIPDGDQFYAALELYNRFSCEHEVFYLNED